MNSFTFIVWNTPGRIKRLDSPAIRMYYAVYSAYERRPVSLLALLNPAKAFLSLAAVLAGYCLFRFYAYTAGNLLIVPYLLAAGALLGMADSAWRDIFTAAADHPDASEELPSGSVSPTASFLIAVFTTIAGLMCAMTGGYNSFRAAGLLILLMLAKSALFRNVEILTPILKGLTWGMLFVIGTTAHPSFAEMVSIDETRLPAAFFILYMTVAAVLAQARDSARPRATPPEEELASVTASRLLEMRDDAVDGLVAWCGGGALVAIPLVQAWILPWRWLSWGLLSLLAGVTLVRLIPVVAYRTRKDLAGFIENAFRGGAFLNAGAVASLGDYTVHEVYQGWQVPVPGKEELAAIALIIVLSFPAWLLRKVSPAA